MRESWLGATRRERASRRLAGGATATAVTTAVLGALLLPGGGEPLPLLAAVVVTGSLCTALSWPLVRGRSVRASSGLYVGTGAVAGVIAGLVVLGGAYAPWVSVVAAVLGAAGGAVALGVSRWAPARTLVPLAALSTAGCVLLLVVAHDEQRAPYPGSYLVASGPTTATAAVPLAEQIAARLRASGEPARLDTWQRAAQDLVEPRPGGSVSFGYAAAGPQERRITVQVDDGVACVLASRRSVSVTGGPCRAG